LESWLKRDPIAQCAARLQSSAHLQQADLDAIRLEVQKKIDAAYEAAAAAPWPAVRDLGPETLAPSRA
jgi:TPP-dependent pyruvate/acetoin dehydrogenase alpha subunit